MTEPAQPTARRPPSYATIICAIGIFLYVTGFIMYPYGHVAAFSFWEKDLYTIRPAFIFDNYIRIADRPLYARVILNSLQIAALVTLVSAVVGYLTAYFLSRYAGRWKNLFYMLLIVPLLTSFLLRAYVWQIILGRNGIISSLLGNFNIPPEAISFLLFSDFSIIIALVYIFVPFIALPVFAALEKIPPALTEASADLGAPPFNTFAGVVFPLTVPGLLAGATIVFCLSFGDFIAPGLLGGSDNIMIASVIISQFGAAFDWPFGSALAVVVLTTVLAIVSISTWAARWVVGDRDAR
jgi:spermidine/putrescine transport system permease protein